MRSTSFFKTASLDDLRMLRKPRVMEIVGLSASHIRRLEDAGEFPKRIVLGPNSIAWIEGEVRAWLATRLAIDSTTPVGTRMTESQRRAIAAKKARGTRP